MHRCIPEYFRHTVLEEGLSLLLGFLLRSHSILLSSFPKSSARQLAERVFSLMYSEYHYACQEKSDHAIAKRICARLLCNAWAHEREQRLRVRLHLSSGDPFKVENN
jgi:hypothetical protein